MSNEKVEIIVGQSIEGQTVYNAVDNKYITILEPIGSGQFGSIYYARDESAPQDPLVIKVSNDQRVLKNEIKSLLRVSKSKYSKEASNLVPCVITYGLFVHKKHEQQSPKDDSKLFYYVMPFFGTSNLEQFAESCQYRMSERSILSIGIRLINALQ